MASSDGFLTEEQRESLKIATENAEVCLTSPKSPSGLKSPTRLMAERPIKAPANYKAMTEIAVRHVRRTRSGKYVRVKKGELFSSLQYIFSIYSICLMYFIVW